MNLVCEEETMKIFMEILIGKKLFCVKSKIWFNNSQKFPRWRKNEILQRNKFSSSNKG